MKSFRAKKPASLNQIHAAEEELCLSFSKEYTDYLLVFGCATIYGHEFTGICTTPQLNVVSDTIEQKALNNAIPKNMYVLEDLRIDGIVIWQNSKGEIFQTAPYGSPQKICNSFAEYLDL